LICGSSDETCPQAFETATACPAGQFGRALITAAS